VFLSCCVNLHLYPETSLQAPPLFFFFLLIFALPFSFSLLAAPDARTLDLYAHELLFLAAQDPDFPDYPTGIIFSSCVSSQQRARRLSLSTPPPLWPFFTISFFFQFVAPSGPYSSLSFPLQTGLRVRLLPSLASPSSFSFFLDNLFFPVQREARAIGLPTCATEFPSYPLPEIEKGIPDPSFPPPAFTFSFSWNQGRPRCLRSSSLKRKEPLSGENPPPLVFSPFFFSIVSFQS